MRLAAGLSCGAALTAQVASGVLNDSYYVGQAVYSFTFSQLDAFAAVAPAEPPGGSIPGEDLLWNVCLPAAGAAVSARRSGAPSLVGNLAVIGRFRVPARVSTAAVSGA
jgi:hypothetical protein